MVFRCFGKCPLLLRKTASTFCARSQHAGHNRARFGAKCTLEQTAGEGNQDDFRKFVGRLFRIHMHVLRADEKKRGFRNFNRHIKIGNPPGDGYVGAITYLAVLLFLFENFAAP